MKAFLSYKKSLGAWSLITLLFSCDYLDVVPENVPTVDHAFSSRTEAQNYLYGCFSFMPQTANMTANPALLGGDEIWTLEDVYGASGYTRLRHIAMGDQGTVNPYCNYWASKAMGGDLLGGTPLWTALSDCNIFLENIHKPYDLADEDRDRWTGEVKFLKAYFYFWLFRMYGPVPVIKENLPLDATGDEVQRYREPVDSVVNYICQLIDEAVPALPMTIENAMDEMGRPTKAIALSLKAQTLTYAASPLFNCNEDYAGFKDSRGTQLFPQDNGEEKAKWERAAKALEDAIEAAHEAGHALYDFHATQYAPLLDEKTILSMQVRGAVTERWNPEIIWGSSVVNSSTTLLQRFCTPYFQSQNSPGSSGLRCHAPTLTAVEQFYTKNGIPIEDDADWAGVDPMGLRTATADDRQYIRQGFQTINLHFDREARFYGAVSFDCGTYYGNQRISGDNTSNPAYMWITEMKAGQLNGMPGANRYSITGYICKKLLHYQSTVPDNSSGFSVYNYAFPIIRLADLYLMYAEVLNEVKSTPDAAVYEYIDLVRARSGLAGVVESWRDHAVTGMKDKPLSQDGMREIIRRERLNELAFEGVRFWDLRRWKLAKEYMNQPILGMNIMGANATDFYQVTEIFPLKFENKDYLWPISTSVLVKNPNLVQNPGW
ncbi:MAG: RagB/SusD family nutrient uptake outer membrane protein [Mangrovibacterium sp.]